ncbi:PAS domain-containing protein [Nitrospira moscoviensis]|uniref:histidine kinase n=1 Tax=Nitrospira moscoviensis TaxID=42253 RepID=A0A0K2GGB3_NITMO|nr:PAS domain-containing protein [Nitrospira moscoviensis]ALA59667.1 hypothetical protein NITMOv2_3274 [Nitrospira moscoviensis]
MKDTSFSVLVVDDHPASLYLKSRLLEGEGYRVLQAASGQQALSVAAAAQPDVVVLDVILPDLHGFEVCRRLKAEPATCRILVLQTSVARIGLHDRVNGLASGADAYVVESAEKDEIVGAVRALLRLAERERQFRTINDAIPALVWGCDAAGRAVYFNQRWYDYTGQTLEQALRDGWAMVLHPDDRARILGYWERCRIAGEPYEGQCRYRGRGGDYRWHEFRALPRRDASGRIDAWYGVSLDITERKQSEELLRQSWDRLRLAWQATRDVIWDWDVRQDALRWSGAGTEVFGWADAMEAPRPVAWWIQRVHPDDRPRVVKELCAAIEDRARHHWQDEYRLLRGDGGVATVLDRGVIQRDAAGQATRMIGAVQEIPIRRGVPTQQS